MESCHLNLDDAWGDRPLNLPQIDARRWGPRVRYFAPERVLSAFASEVLAPLPPVVVYGSGDFHHLTGWLVRRVTEPITIISFDNHPDWDIRPPRWACGGWVNRALEHPHVKRVAVWGCGNFELNWPSRLFANRRAWRRGDITLYPWAERFSRGVAARYHAVTRENWRDRFTPFLKALAGTNVYVTLDLDCLRAEEFASNWEHGLFTADDLAWAVGQVRASCRLIAGDVCGAYSPFRGERTMQRLADWWDHPRLPAVDVETARAKNLAALATILPALTA
jgi:arginase family enzyme